MDAGHLSRERVAPLLSTRDAALMRTLIEILGRHPDWGAELTGALGCESGRRG